MPQRVLTPMAIFLILRCRYQYMEPELPVRMDAISLVARFACLVAIASWQFAAGWHDALHPHHDHAAHGEATHATEHDSCGHHHGNHHDEAHADGAQGWSAATVPAGHDTHGGLCLACAVAASSAHAPNQLTALSPDKQVLLLPARPAITPSCWSVGLISERGPPA